MGDSCGGVLCFKSDVAIAFAPVSPRGSAPKLEPLRRCFGLILCELDFRSVAVAEVDVSVCDVEDMVMKE